ncbi:response regulator transcription factor [Bhargavaea beijingensis]|uniref:DNA-binding response regulator n=1 Tax=Bhargavaea beijingensis TaxID=426756 RepID=A0ABX9ZDJ8_9BACL|nr:response regulator transcription factor [Bhargavaea beijingensis]MCW1929075.1 response regulator transcription factor [Bhargavaea beijingensis]RSK33675.1 DNA-binding response regulator [Bhargavaea beijingensis]
MKIILVDDQTLVRKGLRSILSLQERMDIKGEAKNKQEALDLIQKKKPDLVIVDIQLGKENGFDLIAEVRELGVTCKFAVLIPLNETVPFLSPLTMDTKVEGYISLGAYPEEFVYALQTIYRGGKYYDPAIMDMILHSQHKPHPHSKRLKLLTSKEKEVLRILGKGYSNKQIAKKLFITENTVKKHMSQILAKLDLSDRTQAALYANEVGLVQYQCEASV